MYKYIINQVDSLIAFSVTSDIFLLYPDFQEYPSQMNLSLITNLSNFLALCLVRSVMVTLNDLTVVGPVEQTQITEVSIQSVFDLSRNTFVIVHVKECY